jgi:hypothetical protein
MNTQQLLTEAKNTLFRLKREEKWNINPYVSFAEQMTGLIREGKVSTCEEVLGYTKLAYPRPNLNRQWRLFGNVLEKNIRADVKERELLYFFGYLKRLLTIEGKKQADERNKYRGEKYPHSHKRKHKPRWHDNRKR